MLLLAIIVVLLVYIFNEVNRRYKVMDKHLLKYKIYQSAMRLFSSEGFENVTMGKIAKEVKLNEADLHLYFGSKEDIILHLY